MELPDHIEKKSDRWFLNTKTGKFIHADKIEAWAERYWKYHTPDAPKLKSSYKKNVELAKKRWDLD